jgi:7-carboxy-7-deazaguanine synthase
MTDAPILEKKGVLADAETQARNRALERKIPLMEMFGPTIQGEGTVIGQQTYFLRFGLCDYRCGKCDSLHAVIPQLVKANADYLTQQEIFDKFMAFYKPNTTKWVTFSGGNPLFHDLDHLTSLFHEAGFKINVETQGTLYRGWLNKVDSLTISPKGPGMEEEHDHKVFMGFINQVHQSKVGSLENDALPQSPDLCIKIVVFDQRDLQFATDIFTDLSNHDLFGAVDTSNHFYLSLGNSTPPPPDGGEVMVVDPGIEGHRRLTGDEFRNRMLQDYRRLYEDIQSDPVLSQVRFLPQWHAFVWGNDQGH